MALRISRILHAGYVFGCEGAQIAFDPIFENPFSRNCHAFPDVAFDTALIGQQRFDAVFISHYHDDHCSFDSLDLLARDTPIYMYCLFDEMFDMLRALGFTQVTQLRTNEAVRVGPFEVTPREALDADVDSLFQIRAGGLNVLNVVDAWIGPDTLALLAQQGPWDMVLWPFQTMRELDVLWPARADTCAPQLPGEFIEQLAELKPRYIVPSSCQFVQESWSWYNHAMFPITYAQFQREVEAAMPARVVRLNPSVSVLLTHAGLEAAAPLAWVLPVGEQDVDFDYRPGVAAPPTADIARHFPALSESEAMRVLAWCHHGMAQKYRAMELPEDSHFQKPRLWRLALYDHTGAATDFYYQICGDSMEAAPPGPEDWLTEVPAEKIFAALERGESLTSMYLRISAAADEAEAVEDPLIRCLFNEVFGAYQAAQLRRLVGRNMAKKAASS